MTFQVGDRVQAAVWCNKYPNPRVLTTYVAKHIEQTVTAVIVRICPRLGHLLLEIEDNTQHSPWNNKKWWVFPTKERHEGLKVNDGGYVVCKIYSSYSNGPDGETMGPSGFRWL